MDCVPAAASLPNWNPVPSPRAEPGARLPLGEGDGGGDCESVPVTTEDVQGSCLVQRPASQAPSLCSLHKESSNLT